MRILMINKYARITGGADKQCMSLAESLRARGHEVAFLAMASEENIEREGVFVPTFVTHETRDSLTARERATVLRHALWNGAAADAMKEALCGRVLTIKSEVCDDQLLISVRDTGAGLPAGKSAAIGKSDTT